MKWKKGQAAANENWICILCGHAIKPRYYYIRPISESRGGPNLDTEMVKGHGETYRGRRPCFHPDCFDRMGSWFGSIPPVYHDNGANILPLQDPTKHLPDGKPLKGP